MPSSVLAHGLGSEGLKTPLVAQQTLLCSKVRQKGNLHIHLV